VEVWPPLPTRGGCTSSGDKLPRLTKEKKGRYNICLDSEIKDEWDLKFPNMSFSRRIEDMLLTDLLEAARRERKKCNCDYSRPRSQKLFHTETCPLAKKKQENIEVKP
jgi:hypothetical protein